MVQKKKEKKVFCSKKADKRQSEQPTEIAKKVDDRKKRSINSIIHPTMLLPMHTTSAKQLTQNMPHSPMSSSKTKQKSKKKQKSSLSKKQNKEK